jgi:hypothetical protein
VELVGTAGFEPTTPYYNVFELTNIKKTYKSHKIQQFR